MGCENGSNPDPNCRDKNFDRGLTPFPRLGLLYGVAPGLAVLFQSLVVNRIVAVRGLAGLVVAGSMAGLVLGGILDRITVGSGQEVGQKLGQDERRQRLPSESNLQLEP